MIEFLEAQLPTLDYKEILQNIGIFEMVVKGIIIGIVASAPMGPVGILTVQRTLNKGRHFGLATGVGASLSDIIYALMTGYGLSFVVDIIEDVRVAFWIKLVGSALLFLFGLYTFRSNPVEKVRPASPNKGSLMYNFVTGFLVTFSNPLIIFLFVAMFSQFTFILNDNPLPQVLGYLSIVVGAMLWWYALTWIINKVRNHFNERGLWLINRIIGVVVMVVSGIMVAYSIGLIAMLRKFIPIIPE